jgi:hypothetical protein
MLSRHISRSLNLLLHTRCSFSGGHHHDHHDYHISLDKTATWIKYKSVTVP